jgi:hypothetical protein
MSHVPPTLISREGGERATMDKIVKIAFGLAVGWVVEQLAAGALREIGVPAHTAKVAGAVVGAIV